MHVFEAAVVITGFVLTYKLLSEFISARGEVKKVKYRQRERTHYHEDVPMEDPGELSARAEDLLRRLTTLEEIIASERRS